MGSNINVNYCYITIYTSAHFLTASNLGWLLIRKRDSYTWHLEALYGLGQASQIVLRK